MNEVQPIKNKDDIERMKQSLHGRNKLLFIVGINSSLRISDLLQLKHEGFDGKHLVLYEQKTGKRKTIRINEAIRQAVEELAPNDGYLFPSQKGGGMKPISRVQAWRILNEAANRCNLDYSFGTHSLRKTFAYFAYSNGKGTDLSLLMRVLNHSSQRETLRYIGIEQENIDDVYLSVNL